MQTQGREEEKPKIQSPDGREQGIGNADHGIEEVVSGQSSVVSNVYSGDPKGSAFQLWIAEWGSGEGIAVQQAHRGRRVEGMIEELTQEHGTCAECQTDAECQHENRLGLRRDRPAGAAEVRSGKGPAPSQPHLRRDFTEPARH